MPALCLWAIKARIMFEILNSVVNSVAYYGVVCVGLVCILSILSFVKVKVWYIYRRAQVHKGAIFVKEKNKDNPFKDTTRVFAEVLDRQEGYVIFKVEGDEISITMREFLRLFRVWYGEYIDEED